MESSLSSLAHRTSSFIQKQFTSQFRLDQLDKKDTTILKALAIAAIVFHNFFHIAIKVHENEFDFSPDRFGVFRQTVVHPSLAIQALFAFYGHFGVQIFIFLSAYGLAKTHWYDDSSWLSFMSSRVKKLYPMITLAVLFWTVLAAMHVGASSLLRDAGPGILLTLAGVSNIVPGLGIPTVGPWWFIPFIMQAYALWPFLRKLTQKFGWPALVVVCIVCFCITYALNPVLAHWSVNLSLTPIGRMRVFCLGIIAARYPIRINSLFAIPAFAILVVGSKYENFSYLASLSSVFAALWIYGRMRTFLRKSHALQKIGEYSLAIFLLNGIVRVPFVYFAHTPFTQLTLSVASAAVTFAISAFFHFLLETSPKRASREITSPTLWESAEPANIGTE
jgi:hypothetical protein